MTDSRKSHFPARIAAWWAAGLFCVLGSGCAATPASGHPATGKSYAIYAEFAQANVLMKNGLNRRVFNTVEAQSGADIKLEADGSITLQPGAYRLSGFSIVTMQTTFAPATPKHDLNYPGYCLLYPKEFETNDPLHHQIGIGSPGTALDTAPSMFDLVFTCDQVTHICVGHQSGETLNDEVYLDVYDVAGATSPYHVFARVAVFKM